MPRGTTTGSRGGKKICRCPAGATHHCSLTNEGGDNNNESSGSIKLVYGFILTHRVRKFHQRQFKSPTDKHHYIALTTLGTINWDSRQYLVLPHVGPCRLGGTEVKSKGAVLIHVTKWLPWH